MKTPKDARGSRKVADATRNAVVAAGEHVETLKRKASELVQIAEKKWEGTKPQRQKAADEMKKAAQRVVGFGNDVGEGFKKGFAELKRKREKNVPQR